MPSAQTRMLIAPSVAVFRTIAPTCRHLFTTSGLGNPQRFFQADGTMAIAGRVAPTSASLDLAIIGNGFKVLCARRLVRGLFPLNPFAAEFGENYDVVVTVETVSQADGEKIVDTLRSRFACKDVA